MPLLASALLSACAVLPTSRADLLSESYGLINRFYLEPVHADSIGEASLNALTKLDRDIFVEVHGQELLLRRGAKPLARFDAPAQNDWQAWGETADRATTSAATASPAISRLPEHDLDQALLDAAVATLDKYSHYLSPEAARRSILLEDEHTALDTSGGQGSSNVTGVRLPGKLIQPPASVSLWIDGRIAFIRIARFTTSTARLMHEALVRAFGATTKPRGIVLDLRDDPGGEVGAAAEVADLFLDHGIIVALEGRHPADRRVFSAQFDGSIYERIPLVVVVNGRSASSAEFLAAALQGNRRAAVVGTTTFGKGTSQRIIPLANGGELWLTSAYMRSPAGYLLERHGVVPDICTGLAPGDAPTNAARLALFERFQSLTSRPRISLSEVEWAELRRICPPATRQSADELELEAAEQVLRNRTQVRP